MITEILNIIEDYKFIEEKDLGTVIRWLLENNPSQALPYHNFNHSLYVAYYTYTAYHYERNARPPKELIIAALFHDFGHSGGLCTDDKNIEIAVEGFYRYYYWQRERYKLITRSASKTVEALIRATEYPHKETPDLNSYIKCLRDADMMQNCNDTLLGNFVGIKHEMFRGMPYPEYTEKTLEFLRGIRYETEYGKNVGVPLLVRAIEQMERFQESMF